MGKTTVYAHSAASVLPKKRLGYEAVKKSSGSPIYGRRMVPEHSRGAAGPEWDKKNRI